MGRRESEREKVRKENALGERERGHFERERERMNERITGKFFSERTNEERGE